ncbi:MAG: hypothetical protein LBP79_03870 [Clostridiales bacterium]|nr:hypothetical protein [Clostridiales bacterium]
MLIGARAAASRRWAAGDETDGAKPKNAGIALDLSGTIAYNNDVRFFRAAVMIAKNR